MTKVLQIKNVINNYIEMLLVISLSALGGTIYFSGRKSSIFDVVVLCLLLVWRFILQCKPHRYIPKSVVVWTILYVLSYFVGALLSEQQNWQLEDFTKYLSFLIGGLLFTSPLSSRNRKIIIFFYFVSASIAGIVGILQYYGLMYEGWYRPHGFSSHMILYAALLAFACGSASIIFILRTNDLFQSLTGRIFLLITMSLTFEGILVSGTRGVWVAFIAACIFSVYIYDKRKALISLCVIGVITITAISSSSYFKHLATSIVTATFTGTESIGSRIPLWKGAILIFEESPLMGCGPGNYENHIKELIAQNKIKDVYYKMHAHNIFLQTLATRGIIGIIIDLGFFAALISWGMKEIRKQDNKGGYIIILCIILTIVGGLTEDNIEIAKYLTAFSFTVGILGPYGGNQVS